MNPPGPAGRDSGPTLVGGRYDVIERLGSGAFGTVYKAHDRVLGRPVALKTIRLDGLAASGSALSDLVARFHREARIAAGLRHPGIVTIYDVGEDEGASYLAMEFVDGVPLDRLLATAGPLPAARAAGLGRQIAEALDVAHQAGVVHRDIKPANVLVEGDDRARVTDFGIAKLAAGTESINAAGNLLGTPAYMSPEQARGNALDGRSDVFSLGCVLYEMVSGKKAFRGDNITGLIFKIITEDPPGLADVAPDTPPALVAVIEKCLAKAPEHRQQSAGELAQALQAFLGDGVEHAGPRSGPVPGPPAAAPAPAATVPASGEPPPSGGKVFLGITVAMTVVGGLFLWMAPPRPEEPTRPAATVPRVTASANGGAAAVPDVQPAEQPALAVLSRLVADQQAFHRVHQRYADVAELLPAAGASAAPAPPGYRLDVQAAREHVRLALVATEGGRRSFWTDETGRIRVGDETARR